MLAGVAVGCSLSTVAGPDLVAPAAVGHSLSICDLVAASAVGHEHEHGGWPQSDGCRCGS